MKNLLLALPLAALSLGFSSCCSMFGVSMPMYSTEKVPACCAKTSNARVEKLYVSYGKGAKPAASNSKMVKVPVSISNGMGTRFSLGQHRLEEYRSTNVAPASVQETTTVASTTPVYESRTVVTQQQTQVYDAKGGMSVAPVQQQEVVQTKAVRYKTVTRIHYSGPCVRPYCPDKVCCGTTGPRTRQMASLQGSTGSPNLGLIPTMKPLAP
ncbi:MAG TPA: hypothetical protein VIM57_09890 [Luteolibacter sp.]